MKAAHITDEEILAACDAFHKEGAPTPEIALAGKYPPKLILAKMRKLADQDKIDYGVSLRTAWVERGGL